MNLKKISIKKLEMLREALRFVIQFDEDKEKRKYDATPKSETRFLKRVDKKIQKLIKRKS